jgi:hypothetical protein
MVGGLMNPEAPEKERSPVPRRRWKPLDEPERRMSEPDMRYAASVPEAEFGMQFGMGGH